MLSNFFSSIACCGEVKMSDIDPEDLDDLQRQKDCENEYTMQKSEQTNAIAQKCRSNETTKQNSREEPNLITTIPVHQDPIIDCKYIRHDEIGKIDFTPEGLIKYFNEIENTPGFEKLYEKGNLLLHCNRNGSPFSSKVYLGKCSYKISKVELYGDSCNNTITLDKLADMFYEPQLRIKWDTGVKSMQKVLTFPFQEGNPEVSVYLLHAIYNSPVFFISEREILDKRIHLKHNGVIYVFSSSIDDELNVVPLKNEIVRCTNYVNFFKLWEDNEFFYFLGCNQSDLKMLIPESFFQIIIPFKLTLHYEALGRELKNVLLQEE